MGPRSGRSRRTRGRGSTALAIRASWSTPGCGPPAVCLAWCLLCCCVPCGVLRGCKRARTAGLLQPPWRQRQAVVAAAAAAPVSESAAASCAWCCNPPPTAARPPRPLPPAPATLLPPLRVGRPQLPQGPDGAAGAGPREPDAVRGALRRCCAWSRPGAAGPCCPRPHFVRLPMPPPNYRSPSTAALPGTTGLLRPGQAAATRASSAKRRSSSSCAAAEGATDAAACMAT